jgi:hypothetical protein
MLQVLTKLEAGSVWKPLPNSKLGLTQYARHSDLKAESPAKHYETLPSP